MSAQLCNRYHEEVEGQMFLKGLETFELGVGYYASPIQQVRAIIRAFETGEVSGNNPLNDVFSVAIDVRVLMALLQQIG
jgi:hypothetical protein